MEFDTPPKDPTGAGATQLAVGDRDGKVVLQFPTPVQWIERPMPRPLRRLQAQPFRQDLRVSTQHEGRDRRRVG